MMSPINIISTIEIAHPDFVQMEFEKEINNSTIVSIIEERIPRKKKKKWERKDNLSNRRKKD